MIYQIRIDGLSVFGYHGVQQHEKDFGQEFLIDIHLDVDSDLEDVIDSTVSYAAIADLVTELATRMRFELIESLANALVTACLKYDRRIMQSAVTVHKPNAPLSQKFNDVSVTLSGSRDEN
jgi:dihydroneopterin aldolase